jgi:uncharacterized SAM-binding protein YcdF (DUF218 family)
MILKEKTGPFSLPGNNMFLFLSKLLPIFVYPLGLACIFLVVALMVKGHSKWLKRSVGLALAILWIGGNNWVSTSLVRSLEWQYLPPETVPEAPVIVVLSGGTETAQYPRQIVELNGAGDRIIYASWLYHQGAAPHMLLTGGYISWLGEHASSPAEEMAAVLGMLGVPEEAIWLESNSQNTYENAVFSAEILKREGIDRIILVTSAQHMPRSVALFEKQGLEVIPAPADYAVTQENWDYLWKPSFTAQIFNLLPGVGSLSATTLVLKEYLGMLVYSLRGWI